MADSVQHAAWIQAALARYEKPLLRYARRLTGDDTRARDVVQETFLRLCQVERARVDGHLAAWLYTVCRNKTVDIQRKESRMQPLSPTHEPAEPRSGPAQAAETAEALGAANALIAELPEAQQEVVRLKFEDGLSYKEISQVTGHSVSYVGVLLHHALGKVRDALADVTRPVATLARRQS